MHGGELARRLVDRLYAATTTKEARLCKASLEALVGADIEGGAFAEQAEKPILKRWSKQTPSRWPNNAASRRQEARRTAGAPGQGVSEESAREKVREEAAVEVVAVEAAAGAEEAHEHVDELNHDEESMAAEQVIVDTQDNDRDQEDEIGESTTEEVTRRQEGGEQAVPVAEITRAVEREQVELPDYEKGVRENDELISLVQQPAELEEAVGDARLMGSRREGDISGKVVERAHHSFCFSPPKRDRKLSDEEQQDEAKRPKSPEREGVQLAEQHGRGGEGGGEMDIYRERPQLRVGMTKEQTDQWANAMQQEYNDKYPVSLLDSARRQPHFK